MCTEKIGKKDLKMTGCVKFDISVRYMGRNVNETI
jgi:hypothetical protein